MLGKRLVCEINAPGLLIEEIWYLLMYLGNKQMTTPQTVLYILLCEIKYQSLKLTFYLWLITTIIVSSVRVQPEFLNDLHDHISQEQRRGRTLWYLFNDPYLVELFAAGVENDESALKEGLGVAETCWVSYCPCIGSNSLRSDTWYGGTRDHYT